MRICYLANASSIHTIRWINFFARKGHEVHLVSFEKAAYVEKINVYNMKLPILVKNAAFPFKLLSTYKIKKLIEERIKPDIVHAHYLTNYGLLGALCDFHPFIITAWGSDILPVKTEFSIVRWIKKLITNYASKKADMITADSKSLIKEMVKLGIPEEKIRLISHGVDLKKFDRYRKSCRFKRQLGIPSSSEIIISTRNLEPVYNVELLIKAIPYVVKNNPQVHFIVLGDGRQKNFLQKMAKQLNIKDYVTFLGKVSHEKISYFLANSDIYVSTSLSDSTSVSLLEAMASRLPVIVTDLEGNREWIEDNVNGFIIPPDDPKILAEKILQLISDRETARKFGEYNRKIVEMKADYEKEMKKVEKIYERLKYKF